MEAKGNLYTREFIYAILIYQVKNDRALGPLVLKVIVPRRVRDTAAFWQHDKSPPAVSITFMPLAVA